MNAIQSTIGYLALNSLYLSACAREALALPSSDEEKAKEQEREESSQEEEIYSDQLSDQDFRLTKLLKATRQFSSDLADENTEGKAEWEDQVLSQGVISMQTTKSRNRSAVLADISKGYLAYCRLSFKGRAYIASHNDDSTDNLAATNLAEVKQLLSEGKEGWRFSFWGSTAEHQSVYKIEAAADTRRKMKNWITFLSKASSLKTMMNGFLWLKKENLWYRYYCIVNSRNCLEWFEPSNMKMVAMRGLDKLEEISTPAKPKQKTASLHLRKVLDGPYQIELAHKDSNKRYLLFLETEEQLVYWNNAIDQGLKATSNGARQSATKPHAKLTLKAARELKSSALHNNLVNESLTKLASSSPSIELRNRARILCERGKLESGKTPLGNYPTNKSGLQDGHFRILSLDGGGLRAIMETVILSRLLEVFPDLLQHVDLFAGVSGGSMVASALANGYSPLFVYKMLKMFAPYVFKQKAASVQWFSIKTAKFPNEPLDVFGQEIFKGVTIRECPKSLLITSFLLDNEKEDTQRSWEPRIFHNLPLKPDYPGNSQEQELGNTPVWDCVLGSSAAPIFFPSFKKHIDGAVMCNNPALTAVTLSMSEKLQNPVDVSKIHVLSLGTGHFPQFIEGQEHDWGMLQWASKLPEVLFQAGILHQQEMVKLLLGNRFHQVNPLMDTYYPMDDPSALPGLVELARSVNLDDTIAWIRQHFYGGASPSTTPSTTASISSVPAPSSPPSPSIPSSSSVSGDTVDHATSARRQRKTKAERRKQIGFTSDFTAWYGASLSDVLAKQVESQKD
jgi:patatin-like phospholipase/acyl hydrolase